MSVITRWDVIYSRMLTRVCFHYTVKRIFVTSNFLKLYRVYFIISLYTESNKIFICFLGLQF